MGPKLQLFSYAIHVYKICILAMPLTFSGEVSPKFGYVNAKFTESLSLSGKILAKNNQIVEVASPLLT